MNGPLRRGSTSILGAQSSHLAWRISTETNYGGPVIGRDGTIYQGTFTGQLLAFNPDGTTKWVVSLPYIVESHPGHPARWPGPAGYRRCGPKANRSSGTLQVPRKRWHRGADRVENRGAPFLLGRGIRKATVIPTARTDGRRYHLPRRSAQLYTWYGRVSPEDEEGSTLSFPRQLANAEARVAEGAGDRRFVVLQASPHEGSSIAVQGCCGP